METLFGFEPYTETSLREKLSAELSKRRLKNTSYSLRALARDLDVSHPALSEFLNGRRKFSAKLIESILKKMSLSCEEQEKLKEAQANNPLSYVILSEEEITLSREWYVEALSELVKVKNFSSDPKWIAGALGLKIETAEMAIKHLLKLNWIEIDNCGKWRVKEENTSTLGNIKARDDIYHLLSQFTDLQNKAIQRAQPEEGSIMGITFAIDPDDLPKARKLVYEFINNMSELLEKKSADKKEVYRLNVALFPITKVSDLNETF